MEEREEMGEGRRGGGGERGDERRGEGHVEEREERVRKERRARADLEK